VRHPVLLQAHGSQKAHAHIVGVTAARQRKAGHACKAVMAGSQAASAGQLALHLQPA
jgi:hypothetical protein